MLKKILIAIGAIVAVFLAVAAMQPSTFKVTRSATIPAPPSAAFGMVNDFHNWAQWSPWEKLDPAMKKTYDGSASGNGAVYSWVGNDQVGEGRMTIVESKPDEMVRIKLEFLKPFASTNDTQFDFKPEGGGTNVTWTMSGDSNFMAKAMTLVMGSMDKMIGPDFEKGLANMKSAAAK